MSHGRVAAGCGGLFVVVAFGLSFLSLIGLVGLAGWGAILLVTAHAVHPVQTTGIIADAAHRLREKGLLLDFNADTAAVVTDGQRDDRSKVRPG